MKGKGFVVHVALTSSLDRMDADSRSAVIGAAYSKARGLNDFKLPKRLACFQFLVDGIADEAIAISATERLPPLSGAERAARHRAKVKAESNESNESNARNGVTHKEVSNEVIREARVTPDDLKIAAHNLGIPDDFALGYFAAEMEKLDWMARGTNGAMFKVTRTNLASVLRGWWGQENRKNSARASGGVEPAADVPTVTEGDLIS